MEKSTDLCKVCHQYPLEWADEYCQECWEKYCNDTWWEMIDRLAVPQSSKPCANSNRIVS